MDQIYNHPQLSKSIYRCLFLLSNFASLSNYALLPIVFKPPVLEALRYFLVAFRNQLDCLFQLIKIFQSLCNEP